jgi:MFS family permease
MDYSRNVKILTWQGFFIGFVLWAPVAAIYFSKVSGSFALGMSIFSVAMISSALFEIPTGVYSDIIGRKNTTLLGGLMYTIAFILYALGFSYWWLVAGAIMEGFARALYSGNNDALLYDSLNHSNKKHELEKWMGYIGSAEQWALGISALLGGIIAAFSMKMVLWLSVIPVFLCFVTSLWLTDVKNDKNGSGNIYLHIQTAWKYFLSNKKLKLLSLSDIIGFGLGESSFQFRSVFVAGLWPAWAIGLSQSLSNFGAAIGFIFSSKIIKRFKAETIYFWGVIYSRLADFIALIWPNMASPAIMSSTSLFYGPGMVAKNSIFQKEFSDSQRATMGSLTSFLRSIFFGLTAVTLGSIADLFTPRFALIIYRILSISVIYLSWRILKTVKKDN